MRHFIRRAALFDQTQALMHAKAVLFVDNRKAQIAKLHAFLHQCVRAHAHGCALAQALQRRVARAALNFASQPQHLDA